MPRTLEALDEAIDCLNKLVDQKFLDAKDAIEVARTGMERRLEGMNEFRAQLDKQAGNFIGRIELEDKLKILGRTMKNMEDRIQGVELLKAEITGKIWTLGIGLSILVIVLEFITGYVVGKR